MSSKVKKIQLGVFLAAFALLAIVWAATRYQNTWLYVAMIPVIIPNPWWVALIKKITKKD